MKKYTKPTIDITKIDSGESIMKVSSVNINENIVKSTKINQLNSWHS
jgi:hypothetical protein